MEFEVREFDEKKKRPVIYSRHVLTDLGTYMFYNSKLGVNELKIKIMINNE